MLPDGTTVALCGTLGAGKTRLVQAIAEAAGVDRRDVLSPTFVLIQEYHGRRSIYHIDAYRLRDEDEFLALGPEEYFDGRRPGAGRMGRSGGALPAARIASKSTSRSPARSRGEFEVCSVGDGYAATDRRIAATAGTLRRPAIGGDGIIHRIDKSPLRRYSYEEALHFACPGCDGCA